MNLAVPPAQLRPATGFERAIDWKPFGDFPHFEFSILHVDPERGLADVVFKFHAGRQIVLHRHKALNHTLVLQGEHLIYEMDGRLRERRATGSYTVSPASEKPHREGGGEHEDVIVLFSMRPLPGELLYEILDDAGQKIAEITMETLQALSGAGATPKI